MAAEHPYRWPSSLSPRLAVAKARVSAIRGLPLAPAAVDSLRRWLRIHHVYHSNASEGNRLTLSETRVVHGGDLSPMIEPMLDALSSSLAEYERSIDEAKRQEESARPPKPGKESRKTRSAPWK